MWLRDVAQFIIGRIHRAFAENIMAGASQIMVRKNSVLAPFEMIHLDQWKNFSIDDPRDLYPHDRKWIDPFSHPFPRLLRVPTSATGPQGEKLYSIHIVPAAMLRSAAGKMETERQCTDYLVQCMQQSPVRSPHGNRKETLKACQATFAGLSERGFRYCLREAGQRIGDPERWTKRGSRQRQN